ncbi:hypothetical protein [Streptomyces sp. KL116D]|uniref:hypothetical protein n=1 Tax=Streptomyces sp. KL116D TaxID=3045152 RepID=UPI00355769E6
MDARRPRRRTRLAQAWSLPVAVDFRCQDLLDNETENYVGHLGYGRDDRLAERVRTADLLIAVGAAPGDVTTDGFTLLPHDGSGPRLVQVLPDAQPLASCTGPN